MSNDELAQSLANAFASNLKVDNQKEMNKLDESIEETLTRLEELESGIKMLQNEREKFGSFDFLVAKCNLNALCQRVHRLDEMSKRVMEDVEALEVVVDKAESCLLSSTEAKLKSMLKPLLFMKSDPLSSSTHSQLSEPFTPTPGFKTSSFFSKQSDNEEPSGASFT